MIRCTKAKESPPSLMQEKAKVSGSYAGPDVLERLSSDFLNKCYLCEESRPSKIEVDHLKPHRSGADLDAKFDWKNLFFSCGHCNGTKGDLWPILDCTDHSISVLSKLRYHRSCDALLRLRVEVISQDSEIATTNSAQLLNRIYGGSSPIRSLESANLLAKMQERCGAFFSVVDKLANERDPQRAARLHDRVSRGLSPETDFTAIRAWHVLEQGLGTQFIPELVRLGCDRDLL